MKENNTANSVYITKDGIRVDDNDNESIIIYRPISKYMTLEDVKIINNISLPKLKTENLILKKDEFCCFIDDCNTFETKTITTGYASQRRGNSVKLTKSFSLNASEGQSHAIKENRTSYYNGTIYITNKRIVYTSSGNDSFDKPIEKISAINEIKDGIIIQIGSKQHIIVFNTHALFMTVLGIVKNKEFGTELPQALTNKNVHFTCDPYVMELQNKPKNNANKSNIKNSKSKPNIQKCILWGLVGFFAIIIILVAAINTSNFSTSSSYQTYTDTQIINLASHPKIFSDFDEATSFYKTVNRKKVKVSKNHAYYEDDEKHLIYMEIDTYNRGFIDDIRIYLNNSNEYNKIDLNSAITIALDYLPLDIINNYYEVYDSFKETKQNSTTSATVYYYHWKIKENGKEYNKDLSNEIGFKIFYNETTNFCKIYIGSTAVTVDEHVRYLDNKCEKWSINVNEYIK